jgi:hypothetical protein
MCAFKFAKTQYLEIVDLEGLCKYYQTNRKQISPDDRTTLGLKKTVWRTV